MATYSFTVNGGRARSSHPNPASLCSRSSATDTAGQVTQSGDPPYAAPNAEVPVHWLKDSPLGAGEVGAAPVATALANGVFAASGARLRTVPLTPERVKEALARGGA